MSSTSRRRRGVVIAAAVALATPPVAAFAYVSHTLSPAVVTAQLPAPSRLFDGQDGAAAHEGRRAPRAAPGSGSTAGSAAVPEAGSAVSSAPGVLLIDGQVPSATGGSGGTSAGTGMVLSADGYALTNYHVVEGTSSLKVTVADTGTTYDARVIGADATHDVALLRLADAQGLTPVRLDADTVSVGAAVTAIGNGGGQDRLFQVSGAVRELDDQIQVAADETGASHQLRGLIRTDAAVVPGYSGGPLFDAEGEVIGVNTAASSGRAVQGFAIPIQQAVNIADLIKAGASNDTIRIGARPALGVTVSSAVRAGTGALPGHGATDGAGGTGGTQPEGVIVGGVTNDGAAAAAGIEADATITSVDRTPITDVDALQAAISAHRVGDEVTITWTDSAGAGHSTRVTLRASTVN